MKAPSAFLRAVVAFACLFLLNSAAAFAQQDNLEKAIEKAESDINKLEKFINDDSTSKSRRDSLNPVLETRKKRLEDMKKLRGLEGALSADERTQQYLRRAKNFYAGVRRRDQCRLWCGSSEILLRLNNSY